MLTVFAEHFLIKVFLTAVLTHAGSNNIQIPGYSYTYTSTYRTTESTIYVAIFC